MLWRKLKLDWSYAIGELAIVTVGVLIALAVDQWNSDRVSSSVEAGYVSRIMDDVESDLDLLTFRLEALKQKADSLNRVSAQLHSGVIADKQRFLQDVIIGANFGWNQGRANGATYEDLLGSGNFGSIRNQELRLRIAHYYKEFNENHQRIEERETEYPDATYKLVPRAAAVTEDGVVWEKNVKPDLTPLQIEEIVEKILASDLHSLVIAEANFANFVQAITQSQIEQARALNTILTEYSRSI